MTMAQVTCVCRLLVAVLAICAAGTVQAQRALESGRYVLFIHAGPKEPNDPLVRQIAGALATKGYSVRLPDKEQDKAGGAGVDYFAASALPKAQEVADIVNALLKQPNLAKPPIKPFKMLKPRRQQVKNPATYLGVWLF